MENGSRCFRPAGANFRLDRGKNSLTLISADGESQQLGKSEPTLAVRVGAGSRRIAFAATDPESKTLKIARKIWRYSVVHVDSDGHLWALDLPDGTNACAEASG